MNTPAARKQATRQMVKPVAFGPHLPHPCRWCQGDHLIEWCPDVLQAFAPDKFELVCHVCGTPVKGSSRPSKSRKIYCPECRENMARDWRRDSETRQRARTSVKANSKRPVSNRLSA